METRDYTGPRAPHGPASLFTGLTGRHQWTTIVALSRLPRDISLRTRTLVLQAPITLARPLTGQSPCPTTPDSFVNVMRSRLPSAATLCGDYNSLFRRAVAYIGARIVASAPSTPITLPGCAASVSESPAVGRSRFPRQSRSGGGRLYDSRPGVATVMVHCPRVHRGRYPVV